MELTTWLSLATICIIGAMSPGPSLAVVLKHSIYHSAKHGIVASLAHGVGVGIYAALSLLGLGSLIINFPTLFQLLVYCGAVYLAYLGIKILMSRSSPLEIQQHNNTRGYRDAIQDGFSIAFLNPKLALFFIALFSQFIDPENLTLQTALVMCFTVLVIDALWYFIIAIISANARERFNLLDKSHIIDKLLGFAFIALASRIVYQQLVS